MEESTRGETMGLYINRNHKNMFQNEERIEGNNQQIYVYNRASEMLKAQMEFNALLEQNIQDIRKLYIHQQNESNIKWDAIEGQLQVLEDFGKNQAVVEKEMLSQIQVIEVEQHKILKAFETEQLNAQEAEAKWKNLENAYGKIIHQLEGVSNQHAEISEKVQEQLMTLENLSDLLEAQKEKTEHLDKRLENQEALSEKIVRQLEFVRSIIFERTHHLTEKIDELTKDILGFLKKKEAGIRKFVIQNKEDSKH